MKLLDIIVLIIIATAIYFSIKTFRCKGSCGCCSKNCPNKK